MNIKYNILSWSMIISHKEGMQIFNLCILNGTCKVKCSCSAVVPIISGVSTSKLLRNSSYAQKRRLGPLYLSIYESHLFARGVILCYWMLYQFHQSCCLGLGNYWQRPRHLRCSYQHSFMIMMSSEAVLQLKRHYCTEPKCWGAVVTSNMHNC